MQRLEKRVGNKGPCWRCNKTIYCNEKEYQGQKSPQWQNEDGKAHYDRNGNCAGSQESQHQQQIDQVSGLSNGNKLDEIIVLLQRIDASLAAALVQEANK